MLYSRRDAHTGVGHDRQSGKSECSDSIPSLNRHFSSCSMRNSHSSPSTKNRRMHITLCAGYKAFFTHVDALMKRITDLIHYGRPIMDVMTHMHS